MDFSDKYTTVDGVRAVEIRYRAVRETDGNEARFFLSQIRLNSPAMGVLMPDRYLPVIEVTDQCVDIFKLSLVQLLQAVNKFLDRDVAFDWVSAYMPLRFLRRPDCLKTLAALVEKYKVAPDKLCFDISPALLDEKDSRCAENISLLRQGGYHTMISEVGGDKCPIMRLADYNLDFVLLDRCVGKMLGKSERADTCVKSIISFVNEYGAEPIAAGIDLAAQAEKLYDFDCIYYTGTLAGKFIQERYVK